MCQALQGLPDADIVAVGSRTQEASDAFARRFSIPHAHGSYDALWADATSTSSTSRHPTATTMR